MKKHYFAALIVALLMVAIPAAAEYYNVSPNMSMPIPQVGVETGPNYANDINDSLTIIDGHNHTPGYGVQVPSSGININSDLPFNGYNATLLRSTRFSPQSAFSLSADNNSCSVVGNDLYFRDGNGNNVRITQSGAVAGTPGSIGSLVSPATATYSAATGTFIFQAAANAAADLDGRSVILRNSTASSNGLTLSPPAAMGSNLTETLPSLPGATSFMQIDSSGNMAASVATSGGITASNITSATITGTQIATSVNLNGKAVQEASRNVVVSNTNATNSLAVVRGYYNVGGTTSCSSLATGEGVTCSHTGTGTWAITFSTAFGDTPVCTCSTDTTNALCNPQSGSGTTTTMTFTTYLVGSGIANIGFSFICSGQRS